MRRPTVYIAHPYTDDTITQEKANRSDSIRDGLMVMRKGLIPVNPLTVFGFLTPKQLEAHRHIDIDREDIMAACFHLLSQCDAIYLHPGWRDSKGCRKEARLAKQLGKPLLVGEAGLEAYADKFRPEGSTDA
jgi:hypothetical protein